MMIAFLRTIVALVLAACTPEAPQSVNRQSGGDNSADLTIKASETAATGQMIAVSWDEVAEAESYTIHVATKDDCREDSLVFSFANETKTSRDFKIFEAGVYYICVVAVLKDRSEVLADNNGKKITIRAGDGGGDDDDNKPPTLSISEPDGAADTISEGAASYTIEFTGADAEDATTIALYYRATSSAGCAEGSLGSWTKIVDTLTKADTSHSWTGLPASGSDYYVCAEISDGSNAPVYALSPGVLSINAAPSISITSPLGDDDVTDGIFSLTWTDADVDDDATVKLFYHTDTSAACNTGTQIGADQSENDGTDSLNFDTSALTANIYYVCATIDDGINSAVSSAYSGQLLAYKANTCTWTGFVDSDAATAGNWIGCPGAGSPTSSDRILVLALSSNQPTVGADTTYVGTASGAGGGTLTIASSTRVTVSDSTETYKSSLAFSGATAACTDCELKTTGNVRVVDDATLTFNKGVKAIFDAYIYIGSATESGHLVTSGGDTASEWPVIEAAGDNASIIVEGTSSANSSITIDGFDIKTNYLGYYFFHIKDYVTIAGFDDLKMGDRTSNNRKKTYVYIPDCSNVTVADTTWSGWTFDEPVTLPLAKYNVDYDTNCTTPVTMANVDGYFWGSDYENDPNNALSWPDSTSNTCVWNASSAGTTWEDPAKWSSCNSRSGYPDLYDWVTIPAGANQPTISVNTVFKGITGASGGTITIASGTIVVLAEEMATITGDITILGGSLRAFGDISIESGATMTLGAGSGIKFYENGQVLYVGRNSSAGHLTVSGGADPADWPQMSGSGAQILSFAGVSGTNSVANIDGLIFYGMRGVRFSDYYEIAKFDNIMYGNANVSTSSNYNFIQLNSTANGTFTDTSWDNIALNHPFGTGYGVTTDLNSTTVTITGAGNGFGTENDPNARINWTTASCAGTNAMSYCWYLGSDGDSCTDTCATHGGVHPASLVVSGSQGSVTNCDAALEALLSTTLTTTNNTSSARDTGCVYNGSQGYRYAGEKTTADASEAGFQRACSCMN